MELTTFGAVMKFAMDREKSLQNWLEEILNSDVGQTSQDFFQPLFSDCKKSYKTLERTRREGINEMILQPIAGLEDTPYLGPDAPETCTEFTACALYVSEALARLVSFYQTAALKLPNETATKAFKRLADKKLSLLSSIHGKLQHPGSQV